MKKIVIILAALLVLPLAAGTCFATTASVAHSLQRSLIITPSTATNPTCTINLSKFVSFNYAADTSLQTYSIATVHWSGDKYYGTASDTTLLFYTLVPTGTTGPEATDQSLGNANSTDLGGWNTM